MSLPDDLPEMDGADLLGLLFEDQDVGNQDPLFSNGEMLDDWLSEQDVLNGMDTEDFLSSLLGPEVTADASSCLSHSPRGSDSGISDDSGGAGANFVCPSPQSSDTEPACSPVCMDDSPETPEVLAVQSDHSYSLVQNDGSMLESVRSERPDSDVFIDLDDLEEAMVEDDCSDEPDCSDELPCSLTIEDSMYQSNSPDQFQFKETVLTDEERRLLAKEGATIPTHMPLTKAEERTLKRVRRKIRNKQSAQESRKKKKVYVDGLENRVAVCTAHNQELQKKVQLLQKQNISLIEQLRKLQAIVKLSTMKTTTTSTCVMVFLLSFCLIVFPSVNPFGSNQQKGELYASSHVISRNIRSLDPSAEVQLEVQVEEVDVGTPLVENAILSKHNQTPGVQTVEQPDSETGVNSNSSSDFPGNAGQQELKPSANRASEGHWDAAPAPVVYEGINAKENWIDPKPTSVILQQHRSDEM